MKPARARPPDEIPPIEFFTRWVPEAVAQDPERRRRLGGTHAVVQFELVGDGGGFYGVRIADGSVEGFAGQDPDPDLRVQVDVPTWRELNRGSMSAPEALLRRRVHLHGNFVLALKLHLILG
ncbi:MAG TPA: SCP2 sterol-binding domain-containing protein [Myxococcota bacterium]|jgi:putative sterol carrier protein|nr:SCP2 sterol-binding domain-containing protein [Myxococcota bacterium]